MFSYVLHYFNICVYFSFLFQAYVVMSIIGVYTLVGLFLIFVCERFPHYIIKLYFICIFELLSFFLYIEEKKQVSIKDLEPFRDVVSSLYAVDIWFVYK